jgi:uncharacterized protein
MVENQVALLQVNQPKAIRQPIDSFAARCMAPRLLITLCLIAICSMASGLLLTSPAFAQTEPSIVEFRRQALAGEANGMARYGRAMALGEGITKNQEQALDWLRKAAERGSVQGMYWYASMLYTGEGGPANPTLAVSWLKRASENGHLSSMFTLAQAYANGQGTVQNMGLAYAWISIVANSAPLQNPQNESLKEFKQRATDLRQNLVKTLDAQTKAKADQQAGAWVLGTQPQVETSSPATASSAPRELSQPTPSTNLPATPIGLGLPPAPLPVPGADNPLNQRPSAINPLRPRTEWPGNTGSTPSPGASQGSAQPLAVTGSDTVLKRVSSGTAFFVTIQGALITNHHVIKDCKQVRIIGGAEVKLMAADVKEDLAVLVGPPLGKAVNFRANDRLSQGEEVLAYGFPLQSVLATSGQIGAGLISATSGLRNNPSQMQVDVPLQVGNSGGPLLDRQGQLVGMTVAKLNALQMARVTGDMPQNVNFAIKHSVIKRFLETHRLQYQQTNNRGKLDTSAIADEARAYTVALECLA